jgi:hypothetical protein
MTARQALDPEERQDIMELVNEYSNRTGISDSQLAKNAGVDQPMIHHARHGNLKLRTARLTRLELYIYMENAAQIDGFDEDRIHPVLRDVHRAIRDFISAGGDPMLLPRGIRMLAGAIGAEAAAA